MDQMIPEPWDPATEPGPSTRPPVGLGHDPDEPELYPPDEVPVPAGEERPRILN